MRPGLIASTTAHALILAWGVINLGTAKPFEVSPTESLPIEILTPQEFDAMTKGSKTSKKVEAPKIKAEKVAEADPDPKDDALPVQKEDVAAPPPPPAPAIDTAKADAEKAAKAEAKAEAEKAEKAAKAEDAKAAQEKAVAEKAAKAEAVKAEAAKAEAAKAEVAKAEAATAKANAEKAEKLAQAAEADKLAKAAADKAAADKLAKAEADKAAKAEADKAAKLAKAEADKAAKAEADKLAKAEAAKAKAAAEKLAKAQERKFDPNKIASLLKNSQSTSNAPSQTALEDKRTPGRTATAARDTAPETTAGTSRGLANKLSLSQRSGIDNAVREQVMQCWNPPAGASGADSLAVRVTFTLNSDGTLADGPTVVNNSSNPAFNAAAGAARRAVQRCAPLKLPADAYDYWRQVNINFDPKELMGG